MYNIPHIYRANWTTLDARVTFTQKLIQVFTFFSKKSGTVRFLQFFDNFPNDVLDSDDKLNAISRVNASLLSLLYHYYNDLRRTRRESSPRRNAFLSGNWKPFKPCKQATASSFALTRSKPFTCEQPESTSRWDLLEYRRISRQFREQASNSTENLFDPRPPIVAKRPCHMGRNKLYFDNIPENARN